VADTQRGPSVPWANGPESAQASGDDSGGNRAGGWGAQPWGGRFSGWGAPATLPEHIGGTSPQGGTGSPGGGWGLTPPPPPGGLEAGGGPTISGAGSERHRRPLVFVVSLVATAVVSAGAAVGVTLAVTDNPAPTSASSVTLPTAVPNQSSPRGQGFNVASIAARVERATVDITANGPNGEDEGTGMILTASGIVLTNNHVIDGSTQFSARIDGAGKSYAATVIGTDATRDVALLQLHGRSNFTTVTLGSSAAVTVGDQVVAIGNALALAGSETVTAGIISATGRSISVSDPSTGLTENLTGLFQTSAPINPGNSGGPLVDSTGQVIGMNTAAASGNSSGEAASDIGFAIPINAAMSIARLIQAGKASATIQIGPRAIMGVLVESVACAEGQDGCQGLNASPFGDLPFGGYYGGYTAPVSKGAVVADVYQGTPAETAGLQAGDVIISLDGKPVATPSGLTALMGGRKVGASVTVTWVDQATRHHTATLRLALAPAS